MNRSTFRSASAALLAVIAAFVIGCGPSTGGTGTGASVVGLQHFQATPQSLCGAAVSTAAGCLSTSPNLDRPPAYFASGTGDVVATIDDNDVVIDARCARLVFEGTWATSAARGARFYGAILVGTPVVDLAPATAAMQTAGDGTSLEFTLRDANDQLLLGPVVLARVDILPNPPSCR